MNLVPLHNPTVDDRENPKTIEGTGNSPNCSLSVSFDENTHYPGNPNLTNGFGRITVPNGQNLGLGFTVTGYVKGGIGKIGNDRNPQNPNGVWKLEQWTAAYIRYEGRVITNDATAWLDISTDINYQANGNTFTYYDHPGSTLGWGIDRYNNFHVKVYNGKEYCQVEFYFIQIQQGPGYEFHWYEGQRH